MSSKTALFARAHATFFYLSSTVNICLYLLDYYRFRDIAVYWLNISTPLYLAPPLGAKPSDLRNYFRKRKTRMMGLSDGRTELAYRIPR